MPKVATQPRGRALTAEQFIRLPIEGCADLVEGTVIAMGPTSQEHGRVEGNCYAMLRAHVRTERLPFVVVTGDVGFVLGRNPDTVRAADVAVIRKTRRSAAGAATAFVDGPPELAVEVRSPWDRPGAIAAKIADYLKAGCAVVWDVDPAAQTLVVHRPGRKPVTLAGDTALDGSPLLPGLAGTVADLFAD